MWQEFEVVTSDRFFFFFYEVEGKVILGELYW